jgi:hypothetical protein
LCDVDLARAQRLAGSFSRVRATDDLMELLEDPLVEAVAVVTPSTTTRETVSTLVYSRARTIRPRWRRFCESTLELQTFVQT